jgi:hypothetical protein
LDVVRDVAPDFRPPLSGFNGSTGLYAGQQDMFAFLINDSSWVEIEGDNFAPGFFVWNSEVGRRTVGVETFWFQRICANHIVWDAIEVVTYSRKHTANVTGALDQIREIVGRLVAMRDQRKDAFYQAMTSAMTTRLGSSVEEARDALAGRGIPTYLIKDALQTIAERGDSFTLFNVVDAMTRISGRLINAGDRTQLDARVGALLATAA